MNQDFAAAVSDAIDLFYRQDAAFGRNIATCEVFVNKMAEIFKEAGSAEEFKSNRGLESVLTICKQQNVNTKEIEEFVPLGT